MLNKIILKFVWWLHGLCDRYIYNHDYIPKHADKDFWGDNL